MKIKEIKINSFGKIEKKEIKLSNNINIIKGKNESGKTTILKFIIAMLYGISKNKKGKEYTDYEKYEPWGKEEFSGKIKYELDDGNTYEVYREFNKKNINLYNEEGEEISKKYPIEKINGNKFFIEQTRNRREQFYIIICNNATRSKNRQNNTKCNGTKNCKFSRNRRR